MRTKILTFILMAGTVVGCAGNPPPPPPMAAAPPPPPPAPMAMGPFDGVYRGTPVLSAESPARCAKMNKPVTVRVGKNNAFTAMGLRGTIGPDGTVMASGRGKPSISGTASAGTINLTTMKGPCTYTTALSKA